MATKLEIRGISPRNARTEAIDSALAFYTTNDWTQLPGFRPWTHWHFVRCLSDEQRHRLSNQVHHYMAGNGVKNPDFPSAP
jgi:hypothetical protein